ncbi:MAG: tetratricopeptide repeat protein [Burkholderiaceae bacterium]
MAYNFEEQEQLDDLKAWWGRYGNFILTVITVVALSVAGWRLWGWYQNQQAGEAAVAFEVLRTAATQDDVAKVGAAAAAIHQKHGASIYAPLASLVAAKAQFDNKDLPAAKASLQWILDNAPESEFAPIARIRLAGVMLDAGEAEQALSLFEAPMPKPFQSQAEDRRGDLLMALGRTEEARAAYQRALESAPPRSGQGAEIQLKLDGLGAAKS